MKTWRIRFYIGAAVVSVTLSILNCRKENGSRSGISTLTMLERRRQQWNSRETGMVRRMTPPGRYGDKNIQKAVVAPWTKLPLDEQQMTKATSPARSFVFADIAKVGVEYGIPMTSLDHKYHEMIQEELKKRLCLRSSKRSINPHSTWKCKRQVEILRCVSCNEQDGTWYSAVSQTGAVFGRVDEENSKKSISDSNQTLPLRFPNYNDGPFMYEQMDIAVPIAGQDEKLRKFVARLNPSIRQFRAGMYGSRISIRLLVSRFPFDTPSANDTAQLEAFRQNLTVTAGLDSLEDDVVFVPVNADNDEFNRAKAINALHQVAHHDDNSVLAVIDVDLSIGPKFLRNALTFPFPQTTAYFPIMWSEFNPESVESVDEFFPSIKKAKFSIHHGHWRQFSYGMYVIAGSDAARLAMDESFVGWGGEDNDFFYKVRKQLNVIRLHEMGLTHVWHSKHCNLGGFVKNKYFRDCVASMSHFEGSQLGMYLKYLKEQNRTEYDQIIAAANQKEALDTKASAELSPEESADLYEEGPTILVGVISSRENFSTRVKGIVKTWGEPENIPEGTTLRFFVGSPPEGSEFAGRPIEDISHLAAAAGIKDLSTIVVMDGVVDDEYPPVRKNTAMIERMNRIAESFENDLDSPLTFQWIYKVDDDAYVNFDALLNFLRTRRYDRYSVFGEQGIGRAEDRKGLRRAGIKKPYCTGGPGYVMSRNVVKETASRFTDCVNFADASQQRKYLWHSDSVIGLCIFNTTGAGCWDDHDYFKHRVFRHNLNKEDPFIKTSELYQTIATHPFKGEESMMKQHMRYVHLASGRQ